MKYSAQDIISMRRSVASLSRGLTPEDIERQLLTYMSNETSAEELSRAAAAEMKQWIEQREAIQRAIHK